MLVLVQSKYGSLINKGIINFKIYDNKLKMREWVLIKIKKALAIQPIIRQIKYTNDIFKLLSILN